LAAIAKQCQAAGVPIFVKGVPIFVKQDSAFAPGKQGRIPDVLWALTQFPAAASS